MSFVSRTCALRIYEVGKALAIGIADCISTFSGTVCEYTLYQKAVFRALMGVRLLSGSHHGRLLGVRKRVAAYFSKLCTLCTWTWWTRGWKRNLGEYNGRLAVVYQHKRYSWRPEVSLSIREQAMYTRYGLVSLKSATLHITKLFFQSRGMWSIGVDGIVTDECWRVLCSQQPSVFSRWSNYVSMRTISFLCIVRSKRW